MKKTLQYAAAYALLLLILLLGMWLFLVGREVLTGLLRVYFVGESFNRSYQAGFFDRMLTLALGLGWLVLFVVAEELLRRGISKGGYLRIFARFIGVELLLAAVVDGILLLFLSDGAPVGWARGLILAAELVFGLLFVFLGWSKRSPWYVKRKPGVLSEPPILTDTSTHH